MLAEHSNTTATALAGIRVVDLSNSRAGAQATQTLADFGAEVVHIEPPGGSPLRREAGHPFVCRGKRSIVLDLTTAADRAVARDLALGADVFVETFRPGVVERLGLGFDDLAKDNPGLVYGSVTAFGRTGRYSGVKGYESLLLARSGALHVSGSMVARPGPAHVSVPYATYGAAQQLLTGILGALHEREHSGRGQRVDASLLKGLASLGTWNWYLRVITEKFPDAFSSAGPVSDDGLPMTPMVFMLLVALSKDGRWMQFSQVQPHLYMAMLKAMGLEWMITDDEWKGAVWAQDRTKLLEFWNRLIEAAASKTIAEWQDVFEQDHNVWAETMRHGSELLDHKQMQHLGAVIEIDDPTHGPVRQPGPVARLTATPGRAVTGAPLLDADGPELRANRWAPCARRVSADIDDRPVLEGVTVLEFGTFFAAPFGSTVLRELGARVVKVEPITGEPMRNILGFPEVSGAKMMQGKESIAVDLGTDEGLAIAHELTRRADIVLQSFRAGKADNRGVDGETLRKVNPSLIYLNAPGYGEDGPCGDRPAFAPTIGAGTGMTMRNMGPSVLERPGLSTGETRANAMRLMGSGATEYAQADGISALTVASIMALGLLVRDRTGISQEMLTTMITSGAHALADDMVEYANRPASPQADSELYGFGARYRLYPTAEGWVYLAAPMAAEWDSLVAAMHDDVDLTADQRFADEASRRDNDHALAELLGTTFLGKSAQQWEDQLLAHDIGCVRVAEESVEAVLQGEFGRDAGLLVEVDHPTFGTHDRLTPYIAFSRSATIAEPGVLAGQHTDAILSELGFSADAIADLRTRKIVA
jgi:crotonobetainyl-CoA:carnitine CoA-transferase CaiB-like acyl-CoA transferase